MRRRALCENLPDMSLGHSKRRETTKRSHELRRAVRDTSWGLSDRVPLGRMPTSDEASTVDVALWEKPYELPSRTIWSAKNSVICRLLSNLTLSLTVTNRNRMAEEFLPSDLPSKPFDRRRKVIFEISVSYAWEPIDPEGLWIIPTQS